MSDPIGVLICDDQPMVRAGLRVILDTLGFEVVGEAESGLEAVSKARTLNPDVVLMDIRMPGMNGLDATARLAGPGVADPIAVVVVTTFDHDEYVHSAIRNGASGFILKDVGPALLKEAIEAAARGDALISPSVTVRLLEKLAGVNLDSEARQPVDPLSAREEEVLKLVAIGRTNEEIASELYISFATVKSHLSNLSTKIGARNRVELAAWTWDSGRMRQP
ncbi:MAG: response regulator [Acidimicrobiia bacterium]